MFERQLDIRFVFPSRSQIADANTRTVEIVADEFICVIAALDYAIEELLPVFNRMNPALGIAHELLAKCECSTQPDAVDLSVIEDKARLRSRGAFAGEVERCVVAAVQRPKEAVLEAV